MNSKSKEDQHVHLKYKLCISGAAETSHCAPDALEKAKELGGEVIRQGAVLVTGATTGEPYWGAIGAKEAGGFVIGLSPASSELEHIKKYKLPVDYHDIIIYTGFGYAGRNLLLTRSADAVLIVCGRMGTLNEFTIAFEDDKPIGVLTGTGGLADRIQELIKESHRGPGKVIFDSNPKTLVTKLMELIKLEKTVEK
ncbi:MAG: LOG family protein [Candidatus Sungbacteria bacterium]|nr:LOG family protein [Candidatus Sungbacteria bacterium]